MGGGSGLGSGAAISPLPHNAPDTDSIFRLDSRSRSQHTSITEKRSKTPRKHKKKEPPVGLENVGNTCYANAVLQCLLSSALSHALLDPASTRIFRRYSSNPDLLSLGSGSVDSDEDEEFWESQKQQSSSRRMSGSPNNRHHRSPSRSSPSRSGTIVATNEGSTPTTPLTPPHKLIESPSSFNKEEKLKLQRREARRRRREQRRKMKEKLLQRELCQWLTSELTDITRLYTAMPFNQDKDSSTSFPSSLFDIFRSGPEGRVVDPGGITRKVNKLSPCLRPYQQEDAHEFLRSLLSTLTLDGHNKKLSSLFDGLLESAVTCRECHRASITRDRYMDLSLDIQGDEIHDLTSALDHFTQTELLDSDNKVFCDRCKCKRVVSKGLRLATAPSILVCHLKRFAFDMYGRTRRLKKSIRYPLTLEIGDFMSRANQGKPPPYELIGVVVHAGTRCDYGHYFAIVRSGNEWYKANDSEVTKVSLETALNQEAYMLLYEVEGMRTNHGFDGFRKYHCEKQRTRSNRSNRSSSSKRDREDAIERQRSRGRGDESISSFSRLTDDPTVRTIESSCASFSHDDAAKISDSKMASILENIINLCGSNSVAEAVRDAMCDSEREKQNKKKKESSSSSTERYLKQGRPLPSASSAESHLSKRPSQDRHDDYARETHRHSTSDAVMRDYGDGLRNMNYSSPKRPMSETGANDMTFLRAKIPMDAWAHNECDASILSTDSQLIKSVSSNNLIEKEEEAAIPYEKEHFDEFMTNNIKTHGNTAPKKRRKDRKSRAHVEYAKLKSKEKDDDLINDNDDDEREENIRPRRISRQSSSAPRAGMRERSRLEKSLPPLPSRRLLPRY